MDDATRNRNDERIEKSIAHVKNAIATVNRVIEGSRQTIADDPKAAARAEQRVVDGEVELGVLQAELKALEAGDLATATRIAATFPTDPPRRARS